MSKRTRPNINGKPAPDHLMQEFSVWMDDKGLPLWMEEDEVAKLFAEFLSKKFGQPITGVHIKTGKQVTSIPDL